MAVEEHLDVLRQGVEAWNAWQRRNRDIQPALSRADLAGADLAGADPAELERILATRLGPR